MKRTRRAEVRARREQDRPRGRAVAAGAAGLLVVGLEAARQRPVPDRAHVGLVDAHPEGVGGDDDVRLAAHERVLRAGALVGAEARVVGGRVDAFGAEHRRDLLGRLARAAVDDRRAVLRVLEAGDERRPLARDTALTVEREDVETQVGPVEAGPHTLGFPEAEPGDDLLCDLRRRGRGAGHRRRVAELADDRGQSQIVGPEVVAPLGHAVRLVDDEQRDRPLRDRVAEGGRGEPLGGGEDDRRGAAADVRERLLIVLAAGEHDRRVPEVGEPRALVAHERDQRRDDDGQIVSGQRRQLVAEALAAAGGHHDERVAPLERRDDRLALAGPEGGEPEQREQRLGGDVAGGARRGRGAGNGGRRGRRACGRARRGCGTRPGGRRVAQRELRGRVEAELRRFGPGRP